MFKSITDEVGGQAPEIGKSLHELAAEGARLMIVEALEPEAELHTQRGGRPGALTGDGTDP